jgi:hypothetical protein
MKFTSLVLMILLLPKISFAAEVSTEAFCRGKWTTGPTLNQRMFEHCIEDINESRTQMLSFQQDHQSETWFKDFALSGCAERWTKDGFVQADMVSFCYKQEWESFKELKYKSTLSSYNSGRGEACFKVWKSNPGAAFGKTAECYSKGTEVANFALPKALLFILGASPSTETAGGAAKSGAEMD